MEYCENGDLNQFINQKKDKNEFLTEEEILKWLI